MPAWLAPVIASGVGAIGQAFGQQSANDANKKIAREQMNFQERMSSSAHQREVADLRAAGLNPILSANAGASTPAGASATMENTMTGLADSAKEIGKSPMVAKQFEAGLDLTEAQTNQANAQATKARIEAEVAKKDIPRANIVNQIYDAAKPYINKLKEYSSPSTLSPREAAKQKAVDQLNRKYNIKRMP